MICFAHHSLVHLITFQGLATTTPHHLQTNFDKPPWVHSLHCYFMSFFTSWWLKWRFLAIMMQQYMWMIR